MELLAVPTTLCETMIKVTIKYLQKGMREPVFKNKDRNDKLGFENYIRPVLFRIRTQASRLQHNHSLAGWFADKRGGDMELRY
jgi:hypothetical protein